MEVIISQQPSCYISKHPHTAKYTTLLLIVFVNQAVAAAIAFSIVIDF